MFEFIMESKFVSRYVFIIYQNYKQTRFVIEVKKKMIDVHVLICLASRPVYTAKTPSSVSAFYIILSMRLFLLV